MPHSAAIFILTGAPGAGKTSVARELAQRFELGLHLSVDELRDWVVAGKVEPIPLLTPPAAHQLRLARQSAGSIADIYSRGGCTVVIDDVLVSADLQALFNHTQPGCPVHTLFLRPSFDEVIARNSARYIHFDRQKWTPVIQELYHELSLRNTPADGWTVLDTTRWSVMQTVDTILQRVAAAPDHQPPL
jgi:hypothetical protein